MTTAETNAGDYKDHYLEDGIDEEGRSVKRTKFFHTENTPSPQPSTTNIDDDSDKFASRVRSIIGSVEDDTLTDLREKSQGNVENAVNMYFDGSAGQREAAGEQQPQEVTEIEQPTQEALNQQPPTSSQECVDYGLVKPWQKRYIGSFQAECLATRSGNNLLQYGEKLTVKRVHPSNKVRLKSRNNIANNTNHEDYVVRLAKEDGSEIARFSEQDGRFTSVLIDCGLCYFTGTGILAEERVRLGDYMVIQVDCYLLKSAFYADMLPPSLNQNSSESSSKSKYNSAYLNQDNATESPDDKIMRLRQLGLANLFNKLDIKPKPVSGSSSTELPSLETPDLVKATEAMGAPVPSYEDEESSEKEFGQDELDALYKRSEPPDTYLDEVDPPSDTFNLELRPYQKKGLNWMIQKETPEGEDREVCHNNNEPMHPLWQAFSWPSQLEHMNEQKHDINDDTNEYDNDNVFYVNLYSGELSLIFPKQQKSVLGGILADEMGLGKTISTMALIHFCKYDRTTSVDRENALRKDFAKYTTLVVAPISLLAQWESEAYSASKNDSIRVLTYHGVNTGGDIKSLLCGKDEKYVPNVVVTSYGTLLSEHGRLMDFLSKGNTKQQQQEGVNWYDSADLTYFGLYGVKFLRVVLDEAHMIRNRNSKTSKACNDLRSSRRWVLTGTPIVNKLEDLYSIVKFLGVQPWNNFSFWRAFISAPFESKGYVQAMNVVQSVMEPLVLRRTKDMRQKNGSPLVQLPPKTVTIQRIKFSKDEDALYQYVFARIKSSFKTKLKQGSLMTSYGAMLTQILRLRQVCCHPGLITSAALYKDNPRDLDETAGNSDSDGGNGMFDLEDQDFKALLERFGEDDNNNNKKNEERQLQSYGSEVMQQILEGAEKECPICTTEPIPPEQQAVTECWHMSCLECLIEHIEVSGIFIIVYIYKVIDINKHFFFLVSTQQRRNTTMPYVSR